MESLKQQRGDAEDELRSVQESLNAFFAGIPNLPDDDVPPGASEDDRPEGSKKEWGCSNGTNSCPACDSNLRYLAAPLPIAHKGQSMLVCRINGQPIDQANPPLAFPNGQLYGTAGLVGISKKKASGEARIVKCPQTGLEIDFSTLRKVYIL